MPAALSDSRRGLSDALTAARAALDAGADAVQAACAAVAVMEDWPLFNAGIGSALCTDGTVQMSASVMRGPDRQAGGVAALTRARHPVQTAAAVLHSDQVLLVGPDGDRFAADHGVESLANEAFVTERQRRRLHEHVHGDDHGTVGAVVRDHAGALAAATSTGGVTAQPPGRVGDSPLIGAGTWADDRVAVSCTGDGEFFIRALAAAQVGVRVAAGETLTAAADAVLADVRALGGYGGLIAVDRDGRVTAPYTTDTMLHGVWRAGEEATVRVPAPVSA